MPYFRLIPRRNQRALARGMNAHCFLLGREPRPLGLGAPLKRALKSVYNILPFKKELFSLLKLVYIPHESLYKHLYFKDICPKSYTDDRVLFKHIYGSYWLGKMQAIGLICF